MSAIEQDLSRFSLEREIFQVTALLKSLFVSIDKQEFDRDRITVQGQINQQETILGELQFRLNETQDIPSLLDPLILQIKEVQNKLLTFRKLGGRDDAGSSERLELKRQETQLSEFLFEQKDLFISLEEQESIIPSDTIPQDNTLRNLLLAGAVIAIL